MNNDALVRKWLSREVMHHMHLQGSNMSVINSELYSYELQIAQIYDGEFVLVLPHDTASTTTNSHISLVSTNAHNSDTIKGVWHVPELALYAHDNMAHFERQIFNATCTALDTRKSYKRRRGACLYYYSAMVERDTYWEAVTRYGTRYPEIPEPDATVLSVVEAIEHAGDMKFLGQLALEGDIHNITEQDKMYRRYTHF